MVPLSLRLPEWLHRQLKELAWRGDRNEFERVVARVLDEKPEPDGRL